MGLTPGQLPVETAAPTAAAAPNPSQTQADGVSAALNSPDRATQVRANAVMRMWERASGSTWDLRALPPEVAQVIMDARNATMAKINEAFAESNARIAAANKKHADKRQIENTQVAAERRNVIELTRATVPDSPSRGLTRPRRGGVAT